MKCIALTATLAVFVGGPTVLCFDPGSLPPQASAESPELLKASDLSKEVVRLYAEQKYKEALEPARQALDIREKALDKDNQLVGDALSNLGAVYLALHRYSEAEPCYKRAVEINEKTHGPGSPVLPPLLDNL